MLIGSSAPIVELRRMIRKLGRSTAPVLLIGETGTGKEVVAREIHEAGGRGPFVPIDCSVLGTLLESELFGHMRGAFTGAVVSKPGLLEMAEGGTAFFDEVGELPLDIQAKLLRVLQEKEIRPLGSTVRRKAEFRVIAATNRDLSAAAKAGAFRSDLYYRLNVVTLRLPPLRDRKDDIPELVRHFLARYGRGHNLSPSVEEALMDYDWPGNVRELENCVQRMVAINSGPALDVPDLPSAIANQANRSGVMESLEALADAAASVAPRISGQVRVRVVPLEQMEREAILDALNSTGGDRARTAEMLGIGRTTLYRRLKRYGIEE